MNQTVFEPIFPILAVGIVLAIYYWERRRQAKQFNPPEGVNEWIDSRMQEPVTRSEDLFGQPSWLIVYNKYNNSPDGEEAICRAVTWAFCRGRTIEPVEYGVSRAKDAIAADVSGTMVICQKRSSFLVADRTSDDQCS
ncbi:MAG TPA: hypothetical protein VN616_18410 [Puia sp.]|nr:hypothetical protein [Puia sp.]